MKTKSNHPKTHRHFNQHPERSLRLPDLRLPLCLGLFALVYFGLEWGMKL